MYNMVFSLLMGAPDAASGGSTTSLLTTFIPFGLVILIFYFLIIRPQNKKQKDTEKMLSAVKKGDKVVTIGGIHGVVQSVKEGTVVVKVDDECKLELSRSAIASVVDSAKAAEAAKAVEANAAAPKAKTSRAKAKMVKDDAAESAVEADKK
ncbi:hypothetical protein MASR2M78_05410 [Treponema sp.]